MSEATKDPVVAEVEGQSSPPEESLEADASMPVERKPLLRPEAELPLMERLGVRYLRRVRERSSVGEVIDEIHILNEEEQKALRNIERWAIYKASGTGALAGFITAMTELMVSDDWGWVESSVTRWTILASVITVVAAVEIGYLYFMSLKAVSDLAYKAGIDLKEENDNAEVSYILRALARAALEVPNPKTEVFGVNPQSEASRVWLLVAAVVYKAKIGITNIVVKFVTRRILARVGVRIGVEAFVAIPVVAAWNGIVVRNVIHEARIRVIGPSFVKVLLKLLLDGQELTEAGKEAVACAVASCIVRSSDMHPNLRYMLVEVAARFGVPEPEKVNRSTHFLELLPTLSETEQAIALRTAAASAVLDGRISRRERRLLKAAFAKCQREYPRSAVRELRRRFHNGEPIVAEHMESIAS